MYKIHFILNVTFLIIYFFVIYLKHVLEYICVFYKLLETNFTWFEQLNI